MRIQFERTGGFAGIRLACAIDTEMLSPEEAKQVTQLVQAARVFDLPEQPPDAGQARDQFHYKLVIELPERLKTIRTTETDAPQELQPLLEWLTEKARHTTR